MLYNNVSNPKDKSYNYTYFSENNNTTSDIVQVYPDNNACNISGQSTAICEPDDVNENNDENKECNYKIISYSFMGQTIICDTDDDDDDDINEENDPIIEPLLLDMYCLKHHNFTTPTELYVGSKGNKQWCIINSGSLPFPDDTTIGLCCDKCDHCLNLKPQTTCSNITLVPNTITKPNSIILPGESVVVSVNFVYYGGQMNYFMYSESRLLNNGCFGTKLESNIIEMEESDWEIIPSCVNCSTKPILTNAIKHVANKNIKQISEWTKMHPDYNNSKSRTNDKYLKIVHLLRSSIIA